MQLWDILFFQLEHELRISDAINTLISQEERSKSSGETNFIPKSVFESYRKFLS